MAAASFTVQVSNMAGETRYIENMSSTNTISDLKNKIIQTLDNKKVSIGLGLMDASEEKVFKVLEDSNTLEYYKIDESVELKFIVNLLPIKKGHESRTSYRNYLNDIKSLELVPDNIKPVLKLTPDMKDKTIYILPKKGDKNGLKCRIVEIGPILPGVSRPVETTQKIEIEVIKHGVVLNFMNFISSPISSDIGNGCVFIESVEGGRRRKRARRTKRVLCRRRRTHRKHRK